MIKFFQKKIKDDLEDNYLNTHTEDNVDDNALEGKEHLY